MFEAAIAGAGGNEAAAVIVVGVILALLGLVSIYLLKHWFERLDAKLDSIGDRLADHDTRIAVIANRVELSDRRIDRLDADMS